MLQTNPNFVDRRAHILDAAETCFVRSGFHRTTVQDVAAEAGMSAGNLYRYFPSKDAIVVGLSERDRREVADSFRTMQEGSGDNFMAGFAELGRRHFENEPREKAVLCLEIWAEATRNPDFARISAEFAEDVIGRLTALLDAATSSGNISPVMDTRTIATLVCTMADGLFVRRAILPDFDPGREVPPILQVVCAMVTGAVHTGHLPPPAEVTS